MLGNLPGGGNGHQEEYLEGEFPERHRLKGLEGGVHEGNKDLVQVPGVESMYGRRV